VVVDANYVFAAGAAAGIDAALCLAAALRGDEVAQAIQLELVCAPESPSNGGTPERAPPGILGRARQSYREITAQREETARRIAARLDIRVAQYAVGEKRGVIGNAAKAIAITLSPMLSSRCSAPIAEEPGELHGLSELRSSAATRRHGSHGGNGFLATRRHRRA
jgi:hypothetical protein